MEQEQFTYHVCNNESLPDLMQAVDRLWVQGHVLSYDSHMLRWQYASRAKDDTIHFVFARRSSDNEIVGFMGFIHNSIFDPALAPRESGYLFGALWIVDDAYKGQAIGKNLFKTMQDTIDGPYGAFGINDEIAKLYKKIGYELGSMQQYFILNDQLPVHHLIDPGSTPSPPPAALQDIGYRVQELYESDILQQQDDINGLQPADVVPKKTALYLIKRYLRHPVYRYHAWALYRDKHLQTMVITRSCYAPEGKAERVVDILGSEAHIPAVASFLYERICETGAEYADVIHSGIDADTFHGAGFGQVDHSSDDVVVPNYFEPFVKKNVHLRFACEAIPDTRRWLFKGDSDQDRPNR